MSAVLYGYSQGLALNANQSRYPALWDSLVGLWDPSVGNQGPQLRDFSGRRQHAAWLSGTNNRWEFGPRGKALWLNGGGNDYLSCPASNILVSVSQFTVMGWFNQWIIDSTNGIISTGTTSTGVVIETWNDGNLYVETDAGADAAFFDYSTVISQAKWFHFATVFDGTQGTATNRVKCWVDGKPVALSFQGSVKSTTPATGGTLKLYSYATNNQWLGWVSDLRIYHRALTDTEVKLSMRVSPLEPIFPSAGGKVSAVVPTVSLPFPNFPIPYMVPILAR